MENGPIILTFLRRADEHISVMRSAARRFVRRPARRGWFDASLFIAIAVGIALFFAVHFYRDLILVPLLRLPDGVGDDDIVVICLLPCVLAVILLCWYGRRLRALQNKAWRKRLGGDLPIRVTVADDHIIWDSDLTSLKLVWPSILDIELRSGRIEFDIENFVCYIPASAFRDEAEQKAVLEQILSLWRAAKALQP